MKYDPEWKEFADQIHERLEAGEKEYGDASFECSPDELLAEIEQEIMDVVGWSFILRERLRKLHSKIAALTTSV